MTKIKRAHMNDNLFHGNGIKALMYFHEILT